MKLRHVETNSLWLSFILMALIILTSCGANETKGQKLTESGVNYATISRDGRYILNVSDTNAANLWDLSENRLVYEWHNNNKSSTQLTLSAISPDGKFAATVEPHNIALWNIKTGKTVAYWEIQAKINTAVVGDNGYYALLGLDNGKIYYVDMFTGKSVRTFQQKKPISSIALSADSRYALSGSEDHKAALWNVQTGENLKFFEHDKPIKLVALSPNNEYAMTYANAEELNIWRIPSGKLLRKLSIKNMRVIASQFANNDRILATATDDRKIILWNVETGEVVDKWQLKKDNVTNAIRAIAFTKNDSKLISEDAAGVIYQKSIRLDN